MRMSRSGELARAGEIERDRRSWQVGGQDVDDVLVADVQPDEPGPREHGHQTWAEERHLPRGDLRCDIVMSVPAGFDQAWATNPYYRSTYALVYPKGKGLDEVKSGAD